MIGVAPCARDATLPMTGTKLPALLRSAKNFSPASAAWSMLPLAIASPAARTPWIAWFDVRGSPASATEFLYSGLRRSAQSRGDVLDDVGVDLEREHAVVVAVPVALAILLVVGDRVPTWRPCGACSRPSFLAEGPKERPTSITSGACGPLFPLFALMASISSPEPASGLSSLTLMPYFACSCDELPVAAPVVRKGDRGELSLLLGGGDQLVHAGLADRDPDGRQDDQGGERDCAERSEASCVPPRVWNMASWRRPTMGHRRRRCQGRRPAPAVTNSVPSPGARPRPSSEGNRLESIAAPARRQRAAP